MIDDFDLLVERCALRRRKQMIRLSLRIVGSILLAIAAIAAYSMWSSPASPEPVPPAMQPKVAAAVPPQTAPVQEKKEEKKHPAAPEKPLAPVSPKAAETPKPPEKTVPASGNEPQSIPEKQPAVLASVPTKPQNSRLFDVSTEPKSSALDPLSAYNANPKYETALAVAREFYAKKEFSEAAVWAKKANQMNRESEEAWLLYAKSYYAQGRKNEAIGVLELFLNYKDSKAASELLHTWKQNPAN